MRTNNRVMRVYLSATEAKITNQFFTRFELCTRRLIAIEIANQTNTERDVVQIIAVHMSAIDLPAPASSDLDLAIIRRCAVTDDEMVRQSVRHAANVTMIVIENAGVALPRAAVVDDDVLPATTQDASVIDLGPDGT